MDPRAALAGKGNPGRDSPGPQAWQGGLFDRGSWCEAQAGWARSVVTGRSAPRLCAAPSATGVACLEAPQGLQGLALARSAELAGAPLHGRATWWPEALFEAQALQHRGATAAAAAAAAAAPGRRPTARAEAAAAMGP